MEDFFKTALNASTNLQLLDNKAKELYLFVIFCYLLLSVIDKYYRYKVIRLLKDRTSDIQFTDEKIKISNPKKKDEH